MARGGGGRSFGGGGGRGGGFGRSFGGRSGGSSRGGSGFGRGSSGFGGGFRPPRPSYRPGTGGFFPGFILGRMSGNRGGGYTPPPNGHYGGRRGGGIGIAVGVIAFILLYMLFFRNGGVGGGPVTASTVEREALPPGLVNETGYYTDELREIGNGSELTSGMKNFYRKTGVQPYLYTVSNINGDFSPSDAQFDQFADAVYDELFTDEAHYLMVFFQAGGNNMIWHWYGEQAATILDAEALDIIEDYVVRYYLDESISVERAFSKAFNDAGERIMSVTKSPWIPVLIVLGVLAALVIAFLWWKAHKKQKNLEAEQAQKIFETPLETFGDIEAEERAKKYEDEE